MGVLDRFRLDGKRALVTGGSRGLGREMALGLAEAGANLILVGREQAALGWTETLTIADGRIGFRIADADGRTVPASQGEIVLRRPAYDAEDETVTLTAEPDGTLQAAHRVRDGQWIVDVSAEVGRERPYREGRRIVVKDGRLQ